VMCEPRGNDGVDVTWKCEADLDNRVRFGRVQVSCEGYNNKELRGDVASCLF
jgi:hypothetical protein